MESDYNAIVGSEPTEDWRRGVLRPVGGDIGRDLMESPSRDASRFADSGRGGMRNVRSRIKETAFSRLRGIKMKAPGAATRG